MRHMRFPLKSVKSIFINDVQTLTVKAVKPLASYYEMTSQTLYLYLKLNAKKQFLFDTLRKVIDTHYHQF